jgi:hypothetical protein
VLDRPGIPDFAAILADDFLNRSSQMGTSGTAAQAVPASRGRLAHIPAACSAFTAPAESDESESTLEASRPCA